MWTIGRVCEEFGCLPLAAERELESDPKRMAVTIMQLRAYARTKQQLDEVIASGKDTPMKDSFYLTLAKKNTERLLLARAARSASECPRG